MIKLLIEWIIAKKIKKQVKCKIKNLNKNQGWQFFFNKFYKIRTFNLLN